MPVPRSITVTGGTGYLGRPTIERLVADRHPVTALTRAASRSRVPPGARVIEGSALDPLDIARALEPGGTLVHLVGARRPSPARTRELREVDLASAAAAAEAATEVAIGYIVYVSVAQPAPVMEAYVATRSEAERLLIETGIPTTILRPWYVLGPGHWWPCALVPLYWIAERIPSQRDTARRLGLVTHAQMVSALVRAAVTPGDGVRLVEVPEIRGGGR